MTFQRMFGTSITLNRKAKKEGGVIKTKIIKLGGFLGVVLFLSGCAEVVDLTSFVIFGTPQAHSVIK